MKQSCSKKKHALFVFIFVCILYIPFCQSLATDFLESNHPYAANCDITWTYTHAVAADYLAITFSSDSQLEGNYDFLTLTDELGNEYVYTGNLSNKTVRIIGDSFTLRLTSDYSQQYYGFRITSIVPIEEEEFSKPVFTVANGKLTKVEGGMPGSTLEIPETIDSQTITAISNYALRASNFAAIILPDTVTSIGSYAFSNSPLLTTVVLPANLDTISSYAYYDCPNLTIPSIPSSVTTIGSYSFYGCKSASHVSLPDNISKIGSSCFSSEIYPFVTKGSLTESTLRQAYMQFRWSSHPDFVLYYDDILYLRHYLGSSASVIVPDDVQAVYSFAFRDNTSITNVALSNTVTSIGSCAFQNCTSLQSITLPPYLTTISSQAFSGCTKLDIPLLPASVTTIGGYAFSGCKSDSDIILPDHISSIGFGYLPFDMYPIVTKGSITEQTLINNERLFRWSIAPDCVLNYSSYHEVLYLYYYVGTSASVTVPSGVQALYPFVFEDNTTITTVILPNTVVSIGDGAFENCSQLQSVVLPSGLKIIEDNVFENCSSLENISFPSGLTTISSYAFYHCSNLIVPNIPSSVTTIGKFAFYGCSSSSQVTLHDHFASIGTGFLPYDVYPLVNDGSQTETILREGAMSYRKHSAPDFVLQYSNYDHLLHLAHYIGSAESITVPNGVQAIYYSAFQNPSSIKSVVLPDSFLDLDYALNQCSQLISLTLPNTITSLPHFVLVKPDLVVSIHQSSPLINILREHGHPYRIIETDKTYNVVDHSATTVEEKIDDIVAAVIHPGMSDYQKALALHNWLMINACYDETYTYYYADGVLLHGTGVCQSYAYAYMMLLNKVGIENCLEYGENHVWNMIKLDNEWYHVDVTWDDPVNSSGAVGLERWNYFCLSNYALESVRSHECYNKPYIAKSYKYNYSYRNGLLDERIEECEQEIIGNLQAGNWRFSFTPDSFNNLLDGIEERTTVLVIRDTDFYIGGTKANLSIDYDNSTLTLTVTANMSTPDLRLPSALKAIENEAFANSDASVVWLPDSLQTIGAKAFADCSSLCQIRIGANVADIDDTAFENVTGLWIYAPKGSLAESFAKEHGFYFRPIN